MSSENNIYIYTDSENTVRIDAYLASLDIGVSRTQAQKMIQDGLITVNTQKTKPSYKLMENDSIQIDLSKVDSKPLEAFQQDIPIEIIFEDPEVLVINKPPGIVTHPGAGNPDGTVANAFFDKAFKNDPVRPGIVHRLDKDTSGLLVLAKTSVAYDSLVEQFKNKTAKRVYWCICFGRLKNESGTIRTFLARHPKNRKKFSSQADGKEAITNYNVLSSSPLSLVELSLETGRTHQIRVHLSELGHPILCDSIYGSSKKVNDIQDPLLKAKAKRVPRLALVAKRLEFQHPTTFENLKFEIPWPKDFEEIYEA